MELLLVIVGVSLIGGLVMHKLKKRILLYSKVPSSLGLTGAQVSRAMLLAHDIDHINIVKGKGFLTDHYHPKKETITLSPSVYDGTHIAATSVAIHESGHAIQHKMGYKMLSLRTAMVPFVKMASRALQFLLVAALLFYKSFPELMIFLVAAFFVTTLFALITLPVELDASKRALQWISDDGHISTDEYAQTKDALKWAAMTYVIQALSAVIIFLFFAFKFLGKRN